MTSGYICIRIDKAAGIGIIVAGVEVVQTGFGIVVIAAIPEGVEVGDVGSVGAGDKVSAAILYSKDMPPRIVEILRHQRAAAVEDADDVTLAVVDVVVIRNRAAVFVLEPIPCSRFVVIKHGLCRLYYFVFSVIRVS